MGSRPRQVDVDGLVSDRQMESRQSWWIGGWMCWTDGWTGGLDVISIKIDKMMGNGAGSGTGASRWVGCLASRWWRAMAAPGGW